PRNVPYVSRALLQALGTAVAEVGDLGPLLDQLRAARAQRDDLMAAIAALERFSVRPFDRQQIAERAQEHLDRWRSLLATRRVEDGRRLLRETLVGPLRFTPEGRTYRFEGELAVGAMLAGITEVSNFCGSGTGIRTPVPWLRTTCPDP